MEQIKIDPFEAVRAFLERVEKTKDEICNHYCKYTEEYLSKYKDPDDAFKHKDLEVCDKCPLRKL